MKYKGSMALAMLLLFSLPIFSRQCVDFSSGSKTSSMLTSMKPAALPIMNGQNHVVKVGSAVQLLENVNATVQVSANSVIIDLNGLNIKSSSSPVIEVDAYQKNVVIKNGSIEGIRPEGTGTFPAIAILIREGAKSVQIENVNITHSYRGIFLEGTEENPIECCEVTNCLITDCEIGVYMVHANKCVFKDCNVCDCIHRGFYLEECEYNKFKQCKAIRIGPAIDGFKEFLNDHAVGFAALGGKDNLFYECMTEGVYKDASAWCKKAIGFWFGFKDDVPETESKIVNCFVDSITGAEFGNAFGISLDMKLLDAVTQKASKLLLDLGGEPEPIEINDVDYAPDCRHIALAGTDGTFRVLRFNGTSLTEVANVDLRALDTNNDADPLQVNAVRWSPDGRHLAVGTTISFSVSEDVEINVVDDAEDPGSDGDTSLARYDVINSERPELFVFEFDSALSLLKEVTSVHMGQIINTNWELRGNYTDEWDWVWQAVDPEIVGDTVLQLRWSRDNKHLFVLTAGFDFGGTSDLTLNPPNATNTSGQTIVDWATLGAPDEIVELPITQNSQMTHFYFDRKQLTRLDEVNLSPTNASTLLAVSPDDKFVAYGDNLNLHIGDWVGNRVIDKGYGNVAQADVLLTADWNPIACCGNYYLAVGSQRGVDGTNNLEIFKYDGQTLTSINAVDGVTTLGNYITSVVWSPSGKYFAVIGNGQFADADNRMLIFAFNPEDEPEIDLKLPYVTTILGPYNDEGYPRYIDWSECGKHIVIAGVADDELEEEAINVEVVEVGDSVTRCVIENNRVANVKGGLCGIGIIGPSCCNLIDANLLYGSGINASAGVFNTFYDYKYTDSLHKPKPLDNLSFGNVTCTDATC